MLKTVPTISRDYGIPVRTLYHALTAQLFPGERQGATWLVDDSTTAFNAYLERHRRHWKTKKPAQHDQNGKEEAQ